MRFPSIAEVTRALLGIKTYTDWHDPAYNDPDEGEVYIDVRLQVYPDGSWELHEGDPCFDTDHRGWWGEACMSKRTNCREMACELLSEARDHYAQGVG